MGIHEEIQNLKNNLNKEREREIIKQLIIKSVIVVGAIIAASFIPKE